MDNVVDEVKFISDIEEFVDLVTHNFERVEES